MSRTKVKKTTKILELSEETDENQNFNRQTSVIDLTADIFSPAWKKTILTNRVVAHQVPDSNEPSTSRAHQKKVIGVAQKRGGCFNCGKYEQIVFLECTHRLCYLCLVEMLRENADPNNLCPSCNCNISDKTVKELLLREDYFQFLEHSQSNLRRYVKLLENNQKENLQSVDSKDDSDTTIILEDIQIVLEKQPTTCNKARRNSEFLRLQDLNMKTLVENAASFDCPICFDSVEKGAGVILKDCFHSFCKDCLSSAIENSDVPQVLCPEHGCGSIMEDREVKALVTEEIYEKHLMKALKQGEATMENVFHCKTPDCVGFFQHDPDVNAFPCQVCSMVNCLKCKAIHEDKTCEQYQNDLKNDAKNQQDLKMTEEAVNEMIAKGEAMLCPQCGIFIQKSEGCDFVTCLSCKLGICYRTKKPRHPLKKIVDGKTIIIDGCHCREKKGPKCHPKCGNCH